MNNGIACSRPDTRQPGALVPRIFMIDHPNAELQLLADKLLPESRGHSYAKGVPSLPPLRGEFRQ
jgi:hypothetical protein